LIKTGAIFAGSIALTGFLDLPQTFKKSLIKTCAIFAGSIALTGFLICLKLLRKV